MKIKALPAQDRPREKLIALGAENLSDAELISLIINSGGYNLSALEVAQKLIVEMGTIEKLLSLPIQKLLENKYLGLAKAARIYAVREITNRYKSVSSREISRIKAPSDAYDYIKSSFFGKEKEHLYLLSLNSRNVIIKKDLISVGTVNETLIQPREIIRTAIMSNAVSIILAHNHPSNEPTPSLEDIDVTTRLQDACKSVGITFVDHIIICENSYSSMRAQNLLRGGEKIEDKV
jgi:DNA repair protein RadC